MLNEDAQEHPLRRQLTAKAPELAPIFDKLWSETASSSSEDALVLALVLNECTAGQSYRAPALGVLVSSPLTSVCVCVCVCVRGRPGSVRCACVCVFFWCVSGGCPFSHNLMVTRSKTIDPILVVFLTFLPSARQHSGDTVGQILSPWRKRGEIESH